MAASGIFTLGSPPLDETLHLLGFIVVFTSLISALFLLGGLWWQTPPWRGSGWYSLLCALLIVGVFIALATVANPLHLGGLFQRLLKPIRITRQLVKRSSHRQSGQTPDNSPAFYPNEPGGDETDSSRNVPVQ
jgi:hypothetical protein